MILCSFLFNTAFSLKPTPREPSLYSKACHDFDLFLNFSTLKHYRQKRLKISQRINDCCANNGFTVVNMMLIYLIQVLNLVSTAYGASTDSGPTTSAIQTPNDGNANNLSGTLQYVVIGLAIVFALLLFACLFMVYKRHRNERELLNSDLKIDGSKNMSGSNILLEHMNQINYDSDIGAQGARKTEVIRTGTADSNAPLLRGTTGTSDGGVNPSRGDTRELPQNYPPTENIKQLSSLAETSEFPPDSVVRSTNNQTTEPVDTSNIKSTNPVINGSQTGLLSGGDSNVRSPPSNLSPEQSTVPPSVGQNKVATGFGSPLVPIAERTEEGQNSDMGYSNMASSDALASGYTGTSPQFQSNINPDATSTQFVDMLGRRQSKQQGGNRDNNGNQFFEASPLRRGSAVPNVNPNLPPKANYATLTEIHGTLVAYDQAVVPIAFDYSIPLYLQCEEHDVALQTSIWEDASAKMYAAAYGSPDFLELAQGLTKFLVKNLKDDVVSEKMFYKEVVLTNNLLKHPNFIKIIAYTARPKMIVYPFYDNGTLKAVYLDKTRFPSIYWNSAFIGAFFYDIANGLQTLHDHGVSHNDLRVSFTIIRDELICSPLMFMLIYILMVTD